MLCSNHRGPVAQLGARLNGIQEVTGSIPVRSTSLPTPAASFGYGAILASVSSADFALALRKAFQSPSAR